MMKDKHSKSKNGHEKIKLEKVAKTEAGLNEKAKKAKNKSQNKMDAMSASTDDASEVSSDVKKKIQKALEERRRLTVVVHRIPNKYKYRDVMALHPHILTCYIPWDKVKHKNYGKAFLNFSNEALVQEALQALSQTKDGQRRLGVHKSTEALNVDQLNCNCLIIHNLPATTSVDQLKSLFHSARDVHFTSKICTATLYFPAAEDALYAFTQFHGRPFPNADAPANEEQPRMCVMFQKKTEHAKTLSLLGVKRKVPDQELRQYFPNAVKIHRKPEAGLAVIYFPTAEQCEADFKSARLLLSTNKERKWHLYCGQPSFVAQKLLLPTEVAKSATLFVKNLHKRTNDEELKSIFSTATKIEVPRNKMQCIGFAYVTFPNIATAEEMMTSRAGYNLHGRELTINFADENMLKGKAKVKQSSSGEAMEVEAVGEPKEGKAAKKKKKKLSVEKHDSPIGSKVSAGALGDGVEMMDESGAWEEQEEDPLRKVKKKLGKNTKAIIKSTGKKHLKRLQD